MLRWTQVTAGYALFVAIAGVVASMRRRRANALAPALASLQFLLLVVQAAISVSLWMRGDAPPDPPTHIGDLATSVLLLPITVFRPRRKDGHRGEPDRWRT